MCVCVCVCVCVSILVNIAGLFQNTHSTHYTLTILLDIIVHIPYTLTNVKIYHILFYRLQSKCYRVYTRSSCVSADKPLISENLSGFLRGRETLIGRKEQLPKNF